MMISRFVVFTLLTLCFAADSAVATIDNNWLVKIRPLNGFGIPNTVTCGTGTSASSGKYSYSIIAGASEITCADLATTTYPRWQKDIRLPLQRGETKVWNLRMYISKNADGTPNPGRIKLIAYIQSDGVINNNSPEDAITVKLMRGTELIWEFAPNTSTTFDLPNYDSDVQGDIFDYDGTNPIELQLVAVQCAQQLPDPTVTITDDGFYTSGLTSLQASWSAPDTLEYQYAIGTNPTNLIVDWKSTGLNTQTTETGLSLQQGQTYYWYVKARNATGWGSSVESDGIIAARPCSIADARTIYTGSAVCLSDAVVTSASSDFPGLWSESGNRAAALRIAPGIIASRDDNLTIAGVVSWQDGVPTLTNPELKSKTSPTVVGPVGMGNAAVANDKTQSLSYTGVNPVGLLATTWGNVTGLDTNAHVFYIDDGTSLSDGIGLTAGLCTGIRVEYPATATPPVDQHYYKVTGIRTIEKVVLTSPTVANGQEHLVGEMLYVPVIRVRDGGDYVRVDN
ncbi:MAG: hypothetical protein ABFD54_04105 [Armatimonadota bacterium]|nr:hypothetical protein [bacterium]